MLRPLIAVPKIRPIATLRNEFSVGTVVHVLLQLAALARRSPPANKSDGIDLDQQGSGAEVNGRIRIEHISLPKESSSVWRRAGFLCSK